MRERAGDADRRGLRFAVLTDAGGDEIDVVSDLEVRLNGQTIFEDDDGLPNSSAIFLFGSPLDPIEFQAEDGDRLQVIANRGFVNFGFLDPLTLVCSDGREQELTDGDPFDPGPAGADFFDDEFVIQLGGSQAGS